MKNFCYMHIERLKEWGNGKKATRKYRAASHTRSWGIEGCWKHDMRLIETPNAKKGKLENNAIVCAETGWKPASITEKTIEVTGCNDPKFIASKAQKILEDRKVIVRKQQNKVTMLMCAISPEYLRDGDADGKLNNEKVIKWASATVNYLRKKFDDRLLACVVHMDESNPHMSAYLIPVIEKEVENWGRRPKNEDPSLPRPKKKRWCLSMTDIFTPDPYVYEELDQTRPDGSKKKRKTYTGKGSCSIMQDEYAETLQQAGLEIRRGNRRSPYQVGLEHESVKELYSRLKAPLIQLNEVTDENWRDWATTALIQQEALPRVLKERDFYQVRAADATEEIEKVRVETAKETEEEVKNRMDFALQSTLAELEKTKKELETLKKTSKVAVKKAESAEKEVEKHTRQANVVEIIEALTGIKARTDREGFVTFQLPTGLKIEVEVATNKFQNLTRDIPGKGNMAGKFRGKGAIDTVIYIEGWSVNQAIDWIADKFSVAQAGAVVVHEVISESPIDPLRISRQRNDEKMLKDLNTPDPQKWDEVLSYLTKEMGYDAKFIKELKEERWINANKFGHLILTKAYHGDKDKGENDLVITGKTIRDPKDQNGFYQENGESGITMMIQNGSTKAILVSDPLDALALKNDPIHKNDSIIVIGSNQNENTKRSIKEILKAFPVIIAEEKTEKGGKLMTWILDEFPEIRPLLLPEGFKTWLEVKLGRKSGGGLKKTLGSLPTQEDDMK